MTVLAWTAVAIFTVAYVLIATEKIHRVAAALGGASLMLLIGATDAHHAFFDEHAGIDWNVILLLLGMMLIVAVLKRTGGFEYVAIWAAKGPKAARSESWSSLSWSPLSRQPRSTTSPPYC